MSSCFYTHAHTHTYTHYSVQVNESILLEMNSIPTRSNSIFGLSASNVLYLTHIMTEQWVSLHNKHLFLRISVTLLYTSIENKCEQAGWGCTHKCHSFIVGTDVFSPLLVNQLLCHTSHLTVNQFSSHPFMSRSVLYSCHLSSSMLSDSY